MRFSTGCIVVSGLLLILIILSGLFISQAIRDSGQQINQTLGTALPPNIGSTLLAPQTPTIIVRPPVMGQVQALADLTTVSTVMSTIVDAQQARVGNIIYEKLVLIACGRIKAGVDLSQMKDSDVRTSADGSTVTLRLPPATIQDAYLIDDSTQACTTRVYDRTNLILIPETKELEGQAREAALKAIRAMAEESGILTDANRNARIIVERVLLLAGYEKVVFE